jgi:hypothetical protein
MGTTDQGCTDDHPATAREARPAALESVGQGNLAGRSSGDQAGRTAKTAHEEMLGGERRRNFWDVNNELVGELSR